MFEGVPGSDDDWMTVGIIGVLSIVPSFALAAAVGGSVLFAIAVPIVIMLLAALVVGLRQPVERSETEGSL